MFRLVCILHRVLPPLVFPSLSGLEASQLLLRDTISGVHKYASFLGMRGLFLVMDSTQVRSISRTVSLTRFQSLPFRRVERIYNVHVSYFFPGDVGEFCLINTATREPRLVGNSSLVISKYTEGDILLRTSGVAVNLEIML